MSLSSFVRSLFAGKPGATVTRKARIRPALEQLEDRLTPATVTWTGAVNASWGTAGNWTGGVPKNGDDLVFSAVAANQAMNNNLAAGTSIRSMTFKGPGYSLTGNQIQITHAISSVGQNSVSVNIRIVGSGSTLSAAAGGTLILNGIITSGSPGPEIHVGKASGGTGTVVLGGQNSYTGPTFVNGGFLQANNSSALGSTVRGTTVAAGATLLLTDNGAPLNFMEPLTLNGGGVQGAGALRYIGGNGFGSQYPIWSGNIVLASNSTIGVDRVGAVLELAGRISGPGKRTNVGGGKVFIPPGNGQLSAISQRPRFSATAGNSLIAVSQLFQRFGVGA